MTTTAKQKNRKEKYLSFFCRCEGGKEHRCSQSSLPLGLRIQLVCFALGERKLSLDAISHISTNNENNFLGQNEEKKYPLT
jgi:hypothetical protein